MSRLAGSRLLSRLTFLGLDGSDRAGSLRDILGTLLDSAHLGGLQHLELRRGRIRPSGGFALACCTSLPRLRALDLAGCELSDSGVHALLAGPLVAGLTALCLDKNEITNAGVLALAGSPKLAGLRELSLAGNEITDQGAEKLAKSTTLCELRHLNLKDNGISRPAPVALADLAHRLSSLQVRGTYERGESLNSLHRMPGPGEELSLRSRIGV
ncbi:MAG: hypothetical protein K8U57_37775 [Planctomycetes bacterium]|nr:hypothetical protein [Planctomycetota bacterium]